ncbi:DUF1819 family protein [Alexandriicola marinus]|uniref:DUF1819 family protein n=1 Tax=Alexandriicola marinus TaxID=2081710 RepID=UPI001F0C3CC3|nr:DUF1819 family protein [Alexandriicola marinus]
MTKPQPYKMSFGTGGLLLNESVEVARLHVSDEPWEDTIRRAIEAGTTALPKTASNRRTLREISNRLLTLTDTERDFLIDHADRADRQALLWLATCRAYRFIREFAVEVIRERYLSYQYELPLESFDILLDAKAEWDDHLASLTSSTRLKLRQVLFRIMREAGVISQAGQIQAALLSSQLKTMIEEQAPGDLAVFPGVPVDGA